MRRQTSMVLIGVLTVAGCGDPPPRPQPHVYEVLHGVVVGPEHAEYLIDYTDSGGGLKRASCEPGKGWAGKASIPYTRGWSVQPEVTVVRPIHMPDLSVRWPQVQCRIDIDGAMAGSADEPNSQGCKVIVRFADLATGSAASGTARAPRSKRGGDK
jgi:hypothetical protein